MKLIVIFENKAAKGSTEGREFKKLKITNVEITGMKVLSNGRNLEKSVWLEQSEWILDAIANYSWRDKQGLQVK